MPFRMGHTIFVQCPVTVSLMTLNKADVFLLSKVGLGSSKATRVGLTRSNPLLKSVIGAELVTLILTERVSNAEQAWSTCRRPTYASSMRILLMWRPRDGAWIRFALRDLT